MLTERRFVAVWVHLRRGRNRRFRYCQALRIWEAFSPLRFLLLYLRLPITGLLVIRVKLSTPQQLERMIERDRSKFLA